MALISCDALRIAFGGRPLLDGVDFHLHRGERIGLVGRNGEGKSTFLKLLSGALAPDDGRVAYESGIRVDLLTQRVPEGISGTVEELVRSGFEHHGREHRVQRLCSLLELDPDQAFGELSGGNKRRALLGRALAGEPDVLLLDEPTNHLDLESIEWLEGFLLRYAGSVLFVTHDRTFLQKLATRIVELDRGRLTSWACDYPTYLRRKEEWLAAEEKRWAQEDRKLAREEEWIRTGIKARRTRNQGRVRELQKLRKERAARRERVGEVNLSIQEAERSGKKVIEAEGVTFGYDDEPLVADFSTTILRGDKVGIIGPNGAGKTTLVKLLLGDLAPDGGTVEHGTSLEVAYFDQHRAQLDLGGTVVENVGFGHDFVEVGGERKHVMSYLQDFLFSAERARQPVSSLSGGERNRLLLARLFTRPANVLVLDEPTNDLDTDTLELLEAQLVAFPGTVLAVSHDRSFLDNLCTSTLVFEGGGQVKEYVGGYSDWKRVVERRKERASGGEKKKGRNGGGRGGGGRRRKAGSGSPPAGPGRLSWKEKQELQALPERIERVEGELADLHRRMGEPTFYQGDPEEIREVTEEAATLEERIEELFARWSELSERPG